MQLALDSQAYNHKWTFDFELIKLTSGVNGMQPYQHDTSESESASLRRARGRLTQCTTEEAKEQDALVLALRLTNDNGGRGSPLLPAVPDLCHTDASLRDAAVSSMRSCKG